MKTPEQILEWIDKEIEYQKTLQSMASPNSYQFAASSECNSSYRRLKQFITEVEKNGHDEAKRNI